MHLTYNDHTAGNSKKNVIHAEVIYWERHQLFCAPKMCTLCGSPVHHLQICHHEQFALMNGTFHSQLPESMQLRPRDK